MPCEYDKRIFAKNLRYQMAINEITAVDITKQLGVSKASVSDWCNAKKMPRMDKIEKLSQIFSVQKSDLIEEHENKFLSPIYSNNFVTYPVIGELAAGWDRIAMEDWSGETVDIPISYLRGRKKDEFIVLSVKGDSMYPMYLDGDKVLILRQECVERSGAVGAIIYKDEFATIKKVEWDDDAIRLVPLNMNYGPTIIKGEDREHLKVIGVPKLLVREIKE